MPFIDLALIDGDYFHDSHVDAIEAAINNCDGRIITNTAAIAAHTATLAAAPTTYAPIIAPRRVSAVKKSAQSFATMTDTVVTFPEAEDYDTDAIHSTTSNTGRLTIPTGLGGLWHVSYQLYIAINATISGPLVHTWVRINGSGDRVAWDVGGMPQAYPDVMHGSERLVLAAGDYVEVIARDDSGSTNRTVGEAFQRSHFRAEWVSL